jgi:hypothetical protein
MSRLSLSILAIFSVLFSLAQSPQALNYQAVARTANGQIIPSQNIGVRISILDGSATGTTIFQETHSLTTNNFGLFTLGIGKGTAGTGTFSAIPWETGNKYLKVEIAPQGGSNYLIQGTSQLLSVPYALYAERTRLLAGNNTVTIAGNTIMGNYQAANNTILITGNQIAGNYQPNADSTIRINGNVIGGNYKAANNTVVVTGNTIAGNYQPANNTVAITGNTIAGNYVAGNNTVAIAGNSITGNYVPANSTIAITGNTIAGNYVAGNNTVAITGNSITGNYVPANNTIAITGNTIAGNYVPANNTISIAGNTIASNFQAGTGINIAGNVISATTGSNLWTTDPNGIHNVSGNVGIGGNSALNGANNMLTITQPPTGGFSAALDMVSSDVFHTIMSIHNSSIGGIGNRYSFDVGGSANNEVGPMNFGLYSHNTGRYILKIAGATGFLGVGMVLTQNIETPKSKLHVFGGDVNIDQIGSGIIMKSPNGQCWRITVNNAGALVTTAIACP